MILAYHAIDHGPGPLCIAPSAFASVVEVFAHSGYRSLTVRQLIDHISSHGRIPQRSVTFTFDDGYESVYRNALPILSAHEFTATVFPVTAHLGGLNHWDKGLGWVPDLAIMGVDHLDDLLAAGWEAGAHTHTHPSLPDLSTAAIEKELERSEDLLSTIAGDVPASFAYPYGRHDARVRRVVAGRYRIALGVGASAFRIGDAWERAPRIEGWYVRDPGQARLLCGSFGGPYLVARRSIRGAGRVLDALRQKF